MGFRSCFEECDLFDLGLVGHKFTWSNTKSGDDNIHERLDRGVVNERWMLKFLHAWVHHLTRLLSDHCPIIVDWSRERRTSRNISHVKLFWFEAHWLEEERCGKIVNEAWRDTGRPSVMSSLLSNILGCSPSLSSWNGKYFKDMPKGDREGQSRTQFVARDPTNP